MSTAKAATRKKKKYKAKPGRHTCKIYWIDHVANRPPFCMRTKDFEDRNAQKLEAKLAKFKGLVVGTRNTASGENWAGRVNWAAIFRDGDHKIAEFRDWDQDGLPYWRDTE